MARKRQIDPIYPFEKEIRALSIPARYFYILCWCQMDDRNGVLPYDVFALKSQIFPEEDIDIQPIINELLVNHRLFEFEADGKKWLWCPNLLKHQTINNPSKKRNPDPPKELRDNYRSIKVVLPLSRVELSRVELSKEQPPKPKPPGPYWAAFSPKSQETIKTVLKDFNIYALMGKLKKDKSTILPEEVVIRVCDSWAKNKPGVKDQWGWFIITTSNVWREWNAEQNDKECEAFKAAPVPKSIKDIMQGMKI